MLPPARVEYRQPEKDTPPTSCAAHHEHDDDPELRPPPIGPEQREEMIVQMAAGVVRAYRYFQRRAVIPFGRTSRSRPGKAGRNEPCPCGSGKKYKRCCGGATIH
jgi:uncharacterized protein